MKKALILGISGGFGGHVARELLLNGWNIKALMRNSDKLPKSFNGVEVIQGDAADASAIRAAAQDVDIIVYGVNIPYQRWDNDALPLLENTARVAEQLHLTIVFPGNVYIFDPAEGPEFSETAAMHPIVSRGRIRLQMEQRLRQASANGAKILIVRAGDYIGADAPSTWMQRLIKPTQKGYTLTATGPVDRIHSWAYLPDVAKTVVALLANKALDNKALENIKLASQKIEQQDRDPHDKQAAFQVYHFKGYQISFNDIAQAVQTATGKQVDFKGFPWWMIRLLAPLSPMLRAITEMRYLWNREVNLSEIKLVRALSGQVPHTPLSVALKEAGLLPIA